MAYVRMTKAIKDRIAQRIHNMKAQAIERVGFETTKTFRFVDGAEPNEAEIVFAQQVDKAWEEYAHLRDKIPAAWKKDDLSFRIELSYTVGDLVSTVRFHVELREWYQMDGTSREKYLTKYGLPPQTYLDNPVLNETQLNDSPAHTIIKGWLHKAKEARRISKQYEDVARQIDRFLESQSSVNAALKTMDALAMYLPKDVIDKVNEPVERKKASDKPDPIEEMQIDVDAIAAAAIAHRVATSRN